MRELERNNMDTRELPKKIHDAQNTLSTLISGVIDDFKEQTGMQICSVNVLIRSREVAESGELKRWYFIPEVRINIDIDGV